MKKLVLTDEEKTNILSLYLAGFTIREIATQRNLKYSTTYFYLSTTDGFKPRRYEGIYGKTIQENIEQIKHLYKTHTKKEIADILQIPRPSFYRIVNLLKILPKKETDRYLDKHIKELRELREIGLSYKEISDYFKVSLCCVSAYCVDKGIETSSDSISKYYGHKEEMIKLRAEGKTLEEIAQIFGCSSPTVHSILNNKIGAKRTKGLRAMH
jgi:DNA-binding CsgD family transcriptional regulator